MTSHNIEIEIGMLLSGLLPKYTQEREHLRLAVKTGFTWLVALSCVLGLLDASYWVQVPFSLFGFSLVAIQWFRVCKGEISYKNINCVGHCHKGTMLSRKMASDANLDVPDDVHMSVCEVSVAAQSSGPTVKGLTPYYTLPCKHNMVDALNGRVCYDKMAKYGVLPREAFVREYKAFVIRNFATIYGSAKLDRVPEADWIASYDPGRRRLYAAELARVHRNEPPPPRAAEVQAFMKFEPYLKANGKGVVTRVISMKHHYLSCCIGPMLKAASSYLKNSWHPHPKKTPYGTLHAFPQMCYVTGMTRKGVGEVYQQYMEDMSTLCDDFVAYNSDLSGYDSTQAELIDMHRYVCGRLFNLTPEEKWGLQAGLETKGRSKMRGKPIKFVAPKQLHTGSQGTSAWNSMLRATTSLYSVLKTEAVIKVVGRLKEEFGWSDELLDSLYIPHRLKQAGHHEDGCLAADWVLGEIAKTYEDQPSFDITPTQVLDTIVGRIPWRLMCLGDDNMTLCAPEIAADLCRSLVCEGLGMKEKIEISSREDADFLSANFIPCSIDGDKDAVLLSAKMGRTMVKTFFHRPYNFTEAKSIRYCVGVIEGLLRDHSHIRWFKILAENILAAHPRVRNQNSFVAKLENSSRKAWAPEIFLPSTEWGFYEEYRSEPKATQGCPGETPETRRWYLNHYDISEAQLASLEAYVSRVRRYNPVLDHPVLTRIIERDLGLKPGDRIDPV